MKNDTPVKVAKKRGRPKKKNDDEIPSKQTKITDTLKKVKRTVNRFKGVTKEELLTRLLPDRIKPDLDILIIGINPGLYAAYKGHHYAGPGNHFWKCLYLSGLIPIPLTGMEDYKGLDYGIGFTNIVERTTPGSKDLSRFDYNSNLMHGLWHLGQCINLSKMVDKYVTSENDVELLNYGIGFSTIVQRTTPSAKDLSRAYGGHRENSDSLSKEIREGGKQLLEKLRIYRPKIAVFNGKGIYEIFSKEMFGQKKKDFTFGQQTRKIPDTDTVIFVMPSSSARCAQFPRAQDKVHYYIQIKQLRDTMRGMRPTTELQEVGYAFDLQKATELAKVSNVKQEIVDPSYQEQHVSNGVDVPDGAFPVSQNDTPQTDTLPSTSNINGQSSKTMTKEKPSKSTNDFTKNHHNLSHYLQQDDDAPGPSKPPPSATPKQKKKAATPVTFTPSNPCLQQEVSEEHRSARVGSWVRDQLDQSYEDDQPPMGFEDPDENAGSAGNAGSDHASQQSTISAGVSGSTSESTSGYGSQDTASRHVRQDRVEMWVMDQQQQQNEAPSTTIVTTQQQQHNASVMNASTISNNSAVNSNNSTIGSASSIDNNILTSAVTTGFLESQSMPFYTVSQPPFQMHTSPAFGPLAQSIRRVNYDVTSAIRPPVPLFSMWGRQGGSAVGMSGMHPNAPSHVQVNNNTHNLAYQAANTQPAYHHGTAAWHL